MLLINITLTRIRHPTFYPTQQGESDCPRSSSSSSSSASGQERPLMDFHCSPEPRSRHHVYVRAMQGTVTLYLAAKVAVREGLEGTLQCWTNLPTLSGEGGTEWNAIDVGSLQAKHGRLVCSVDVSAGSLVRQAERGKSLEYGLTWRVLLDGTISWLYQTGEDASIRFHLPSKKLDPWKDVKSHLNVSDEHIVLHRGGERILLSLSTTTCSVPLLSLDSDYITDGATWERSQSTWHTSRSFPHPYDISDSCAASLIALRLGATDQTVVILPVCTESTTVSLVRQGGSLHAHVYRHSSTEIAVAQVLMVLGPSKDLHAMISSCLQVISRNSNESLIRSGDQTSPLLSGSGGLGFCSWEALGAGKQQPSLSLVTSLLAATEKRIPGGISAFLIDDGWQSVTRAELNPGSRRLTSFDMDATLLDETDLPMTGNVSNLQTYLLALRRRFPQIRHFGVWLTLAGYWGGLDQPHFADKYGELIEMKISNPFWTGNDRSRTWHIPSQLESFYGDYFSFLSRSGITFVKVDAQAEWEWIESLCVGSSTAIPSSPPLSVSPLAFYHQAWRAMTRMASLYFGPQSVINCMGFGHHSMTSQMLPSSESHVFRNSQDTFPNIPDSHTWHIYHNALNACLTGADPSRVIPDADMITSSMSSSEINGGRPDWAAYHAAFRACFSSSTIWLSDGAQIHDTKSGTAVLKKLLARSKSGDTTSSLGSYGTVQVGIGLCSTRLSLPLPRSVFADLTSNYVGPALKMSCAWDLKEKRSTSSSKASVCAILSLWNVRQSCESIDWVTLGDVAQSCQVGQAKEDTGKGKFFIFCYEEYLAMLIGDSLNMSCCASSMLEEKPLFPVTLASAHFSIYSICSAMPLASISADAHVACVGLIDKYAGLTALVYSTVATDSNHILLTSTLCRAGQCGVLLHGITLADAKQLSFHLDGVLVLSKFCKLQSMDDRCLLYMVDMVQHLETTCEYDSTSTDWQVDLVCR